MQPVETKAAGNKVVAHLKRSRERTAIFWAAITLGAGPPLHWLTNVSLELYCGAAAIAWLVAYFKTFVHDVRYVFHPRCVGCGGVMQPLRGPEDEVNAIQCEDCGAKHVRPEE